MLGALGVALLPFVIFTHVDEPEILSRVEPPFDLGDGYFADARPGVLAEFFKCFRMLHHCPSENPWVRTASSVQARAANQMEARSALWVGCAGLQAIITRRKRGVFGASDSDQHAFPRVCTLEAMRTQGRLSQT